jgi:outer membrane receptor protein involved in Fe transport
VSGDGKPGDGVENEQVVQLPLNGRQFIMLAAIAPGVALPPNSVKMGLDWRRARLDVIQPPWPMGSFVFSTVGSDLPGVANTGNSFASFLLGQVQTFAIDLQQTDIQERAQIQEYFIQDDWKVSDRLTINAGLRYTVNFPSTEINGQTAVFNLQTRQLEYPGTEPVRPLKKDNFGPRWRCSTC